MHLRPLFVLAFQHRFTAWQRECLSDPGWGQGCPFRDPGGKLRVQAVAQDVLVDAPGVKVLANPSPSPAVSVPATLTLRVA